MLEPLAASVISTVFPARQLASSSSAQTAFKTMGRIPGSSLPSNFFSPHPRRSVKGKEREHSNVSGGLWSKSGLGSGCVADTSAVSISVDECSSMLHSKRSRIRCTAEHRPLSGGSASRNSGSRDLQRQSRSPQRRHASSVPDVSTRGGLTSGQHRQRLKLAILAGGQLDMDQAWRSYEYLRLGGFLHTIPVVELIAFAERVAAHADATPTADTDSYRRQWGARLSSTLGDMDSRLQGVASQSVLPLVGRCLMSRALALQDKMDDALGLCRDIEAHALQQPNAHHYPRIYQTILTVLSEREGPPIALRFLFDAWENIKTYLSPNSRKREKEPPPVYSLREVVWDIVKHLEHAEQFFGSSDYSRPEEWHRRAGKFLIRLFCEKGFPLDAAAVVEAFYSRKEMPPWEESMLVIRTLVKHEAFDLANALFLKLGQELPSANSSDSSRPKRHLKGRDTNLYHKTGLYLYAHQGDAVSAERFFNDVSPEQRATPADVGLLIHAYALSGDVKSAVYQFDRYASSDKFQPNIIHYTGIILAHAKAGDIEGMEQWVGKMAREGLRPDGHVYSIILQGFAERGDSASVRKILDWMRDMGQPLSAHTATSVIAMLVRNKDFGGAEDIFRRSIVGGMIPDRQMLTAVMNAHVEAGNWPGVISTFDHLKAAAARKQFPLTIHVFNTLLKAYVLAGAPWKIIEALRGYMKDAGVGADVYTYSLLIQAACDNGHMLTAERLYDELRKRASTGQVHLRLNVFALTILMAGWLKKANREKAMKVYETMLEQGIQPTSITYHHIIKAYSGQRSKESIETALSFLRELVNTPDGKSWLVAGNNAQSGLERLYSPVLTAYTRLKNPQQVRKLIRDMEKHGGKPSLGSLTTLLDAYRRTKDMQGIQRTWSRIFRVASSSFNSGADGQTPVSGLRRSLGTVLCVPLSIYLDALSSAGQHENIIPVWAQVNDAGFTVNANNWNQLAIAAVRAGQPMRAFQILQTILIPNQHRARTLRGPAQSPVPRGVAMGSNDAATGTEGNSRDKGRRASNLRLDERRLAYLVYKIRQAPRDPEIPLHAMYRISPAWSDWSAHPKLLDLLLEVLERLVAGGSVMRIPKGGGTPIPRKGWIEGILYDYNGFARQNLKHIVVSSPDAVAAVLRWKNSVDRTRASSQHKTTPSQPQSSTARHSLGRQLRSARARFVQGERLSGSKRGQRNLALGIGQPRHSGTLRSRHPSRANVPRRLSAGESGLSTGRTPEVAVSGYGGS